MADNVWVRRVVLPGILSLVVALGWVAASAVEGGAQSRPQGMRLSGVDRTGTAVEVSRYAFPDGADEVYLARMDAAPDALAASSLADGPLLLVPTCGPMPQHVVEEVARLSPDRVVALGGELAVHPDVLRQAVDGRSDPTAECGRDGVALVVVDRAADGSSVAVAIRNETGDRLEYGAEYSLEMRREGEWTPLEPPVGPFTAEARNVEPRSTSQPERIGPSVVRDGVEQPLEPGEYRVSKRVAGAEYSTTFTIDS